MFVKFWLKRSFNYIMKAAGKGSSEILWFIVVWMIDFLKANIDSLEALAEETPNKVDDKVVEYLKKILDILK